MQIQIDIDCETITEFYAHLTELRKQIKRKAKELKLDPTKDEFPLDVDLFDDNCYGSHDVTLIELP